MGILVTVITVRAQRRLRHRRQQFLGAAAADFWWSARCHRR